MPFILSYFEWWAWLLFGVGAGVVGFLSAFGIGAYSEGDKPNWVAVIGYGLIAFVSGLSAVICFFISVIRFLKLDKTIPSGWVLGWTLCMILAIIGFMVDFRYQNKGGVRPTDKQRKYVSVPLLVWAWLVVVGVAIGGDADREAVYLGSPVFIGWEIWRWRVRQKNPLKT
jgi:hypothetical protein